MRKWIFLTVWHRCKNVDWGRESWKCVLKLKVPPPIQLHLFEKQKLCLRHSGPCWTHDSQKGGRNPCLHRVCVLPWSCCLHVGSGISDSDPVDYSLPGSSVYGILQTRVLEWVAIPFSRGSSQSRDRPHVSCIWAGFSTIWVTREAHWINRNSKHKMCLTILKIKGVTTMWKSDMTISNDATEKKCWNEPLELGRFLPLQETNSRG